VLIGVQNELGWRRLVEVLGRPGLGEHPDYATNMDRCRHRADVDRLVGEQTRRWRTEDLLAALLAAGVPAARLNDVAGVVDHPQLSARHRWVDVGTEVGPVQALLPPAVPRGAQARMGPVPALGEHTDAVLAELGYPPRAVAELRARGVVG
jgi:formyl-CoA transferase